MMLILVLANPLSGCKDRLSDAVESTDEGGVVAQINEPGEATLSVLTWEQYYSAEAIERFEKETGVRVSVSEIENSEQLKQAIAVKPDGYDVVIADEITLRELFSLRLIQGIDRTRSLATNCPSGKLLIDVPAESRSHSVPYLWGMTVLAGRREATGGLEPSWNLLWHEGLRVAVLDEPTEMIGIALLSLGYHPESATAEQIEEATEKVLARFPDLSSYMMDLMSGLDALEAGEIDLFVTYNGDAVLREKSNPEIEVILPKEGGALWLDGFAIVRDAPNAELGHRFISYMSNPEISALNAEELHYATPCADAKALLSPAMANDSRLYPGGELMERFTFINYPESVQNQLNLAVLRIVTGQGARSRKTEIATGGDRED